MGLADVEAFLKRFKRKPSAALGLLFALGVMVAAAAWLTAYFSEKGKRAAEPAEVAVHNAASPTVKPQVQAVVGARTPANPQKNSNALTVEQITVGANPKQNRVDFALRNNSDDTILVRKIILYASRDSDSQCHSALGSLIFSMSDLLAVADVRGARIEGKFEDKSAPGFTYPVRGHLMSGPCAPTELSLQTEHAVELPGLSLSVWHMVVPKTVRATPVTNGGQDRRKTMDLDLSAFHTLAVRAEESKGGSAEKRISPRPKERRKIWPPGRRGG